MAAVAGAQSGTSTTRRSSSPSIIETPRPKRAVTSGSPIATAEPKVNSRMMTAARSPRPSEPKGAVWLTSGHRTADLHLQALVARFEDRVDERCGSRRGVLVDGHGQGHVGVRGRPVLRDLVGTALCERTCDADDVIVAGHVGEDRVRPSLHLGRRDAVGCVQHDLDGVARALRERLVQRVRGRSRFRPGLEVVLWNSPPRAPARRNDTASAPIQERTTRRRRRKHQSARLTNMSGSSGRRSDPSTLGIRVVPGRWGWQQG